MSATSNNAGAGWATPLPQATIPGSARNSEGGQNALQALLAFACIHQQAAQRRRARSAPIPVTDARGDSKEEQFALDEVLALVSERAVSITGADGVAIALAQDDAIVCRASSGRISPDPGIKLDPNAGFSGACLRSGQTVRCDDSETDVRVNAQICRILGARSMVAVPLTAKQRVVGLVEAFSTEPFGFNESDVRSLNLLGELILAAIRPEEEDRLAEIAKRVVIPEPSPAAPLQTTPVVTPAVRHEHARVIIDEKFTPLPSKKEPHEAETPVDPLISPAETPSKEEQPAVALPEAVSSSHEDSAPVEQRHKLPPLAGIGLIAALVLVVVGLGWGVWAAFRHGEQAISANTQPPEAKTREAESAEVILPAPPVVEPAPSPEVTGLEHSSSDELSTVVIDLQDHVQYEQVSLDNPARTYFDLHNTKIASGLAKRIVEVDDRFLKRVRMAQPAEGVTRVVLELKEHAEVSGVRLDSNPYRLTIEVRKIGAATAKPNPPLLPKPSPAIAAPKKPTDTKHVAPREFQIVLDAGHGGWDLGTVGKKGLLEKDLVLDIVERLGKLLETKLAAQVIYTRQDDSYVSLEKRAEIANLAGADLFLSVHANYSDLSTAHGVETYYTNTYSSIKARTTDNDPALKLVNWTGVDIRAKVTDSHRLAADVQQALCGGLVAQNPDLRNRGVKEAQYVVLTGTQMPAVLAEVSFVSSPDEEDRLRNSEYRQHIADALYRGIAKYREGSTAKNTKLASAKKPDAKKD